MHRLTEDLQLVVQDSVPFPFFCGETATRASTASLLVFLYSTQLDINTHTREDSSERGIKFANYTTQQTQVKNIHSLTGIRTRVPKNRAAADLRLRPNGHRDRLQHLFSLPNTNIDRTFYTEDSTRMSDNSHNKHSLYESNPLLLTFRCRNFLLNFSTPCI